MPRRENAGFTAAYSTVAGVTNGHYSLPFRHGREYPPRHKPIRRSLAKGQPMAKCFAARFRKATPRRSAHANQVLFDINVPNPNPGVGEFGFFLQFDVVANNADLGYRSLDNFTYSDFALIGGQKTLKFTIPADVKTSLAASTNPTQIIIQVGGGYSYTYTNTATTPRFESCGLRNFLHRQFAAELPAGRFQC